jgi:lysophospholipase L1-like esterase
LATKEEVANLTAGSNDAGDIAIMPLDRTANQYYQIQNGDLSVIGYNEDYCAGYVFNGPQSQYLGKMFNRFKMVVAVPGVVRIGIVNGNIFGAAPRYSTCLVKWLVIDFAAYTGYKEWDIVDTVITDPDHYLFVECRTGISGFFSNRTAAAVSNAAGTVTYPSNTSTSGAAAGTTLDSTANGDCFKSQDILSASARYSYNNYTSSRGGDYPRGWKSALYNQNAGPNTLTFSAGDLNLGVYRRGSGGDYFHNPVIENAVQASSNGTNGTPDSKGTAPNLWIPLSQDKILGQEIYAIKFDCVQTGNLTIYHGSGRTVQDFRVLRKETHYIRALGLQTLRLRQSITLKADEWLGLNGYHEGSSATAWVADKCRFAYHSPDTPPFGSYAMPLGTWPKYGFSLGWNGFILNPTVEDGVFVEKATSYITHLGTKGRILNICLVTRGEPRSKLENMFLSVQGDSISTYRGYVTQQADIPAGNPAGDNAIFYPNSGFGFVNNIDATWWGILAKNCRMRLLRNDAWSGSRVSGTSTSTNNAASDTRISFLRQAAKTPLATDRTLPYGVPDVICSMIGTNDLSGNVDLGTANYTTTYTYDTILGAFSRMCSRYKQYHPLTKVVHFLIPRGTAPIYINGNNVSIAELSARFEEIAKAYGQYFVPLSYFDRLNGTTASTYFTPNASMCGPFSNLTSSITTDALHPNAQGMEVIADGLQRFMEANL